MPHDKVFVITGASSGIGAATARAAAADGYRLILAARSQDKLAALAEELGGPDCAVPVACDVTEWADLERLAATTRETFGRPADVVFANAGFGAKRGWLSETPEFWRSMVLTNVYGAAITVRAFVEQLRESKGHVVLTGSIAGKRHVEGSLYSVTKWAVGAMAETLRLDFNDTGVRVTLVAPGGTETPFFDNPSPGTRLQPEDIARGVMYAVTQPPHVDVNDVTIRPTAQSN